MPDFPDGPQIILNNGDRLPLKALPHMRGENLLPEHPALVEGSRIPLGAVAVLWLASPPEIEHPERLRRLLLREKRSRDQTHLRNGDVVEGLLSGADGERITMEVAGRTVPIPQSRLAFVALSTELTLKLSAEGVHGRLVLADGSRLTMRSLTCEDGKRIVGKTIFGPSIRIGVEALCSLTLYGGKTQYLSEMEPVSYRHRPYAGLKWDWQQNGNVSGGPLRLGESTYDNGIGMHSASEITFAVPAGAEHFEALVGLDARLGRKGHATVSIRLDGKEAFTSSTPLTIEEKPKRIRLALKGAKEMTLVVGRGENGDVGDHVNWADARFR